MCYGIWSQVDRGVAQKKLDLAQPALDEAEAALKVGSYLHGV